MTTSNGDPFSVADVNLVSLISTSFALFFFCWYWLLALLSFFSKLCFRAWLHDTKLELYSVQKDKRIVVKHFTMWKKRIALNTIATELVRAFYFLMFMSSDNENANLWVQICFALTDYTLNCIVDGSVSRQHVSSSLETWWRDNFKVLLLLLKNAFTQYTLRYTFISWAFTFISFLGRLIDVSTKNSGQNGVISW